MTAHDQARERTDGLSRRHFIGRAAVVSAGIAVGAPPVTADAAPAVTPGGTTIPVTMTVNGTSRTLQLDPRVTLLDAAARTARPDRLEEGLRPGTVRCLHGACQRPAGAVVPDPGCVGPRNQAVTTVEGLATGGQLKSGTTGVRRP